MKHFLLLLTVLSSFSCKPKTKSETPATENNVSSERASTAKSKEMPGANSDIVGEWSQQYAVFDQNANGQFEAEERAATKSTMGFNWFKFNADGSCQYDSDAKFKGRYEVLGAVGKRQLNVTVNGFGETYKYNVVEPVGDELVLLASGVFMVYVK